MSYKLDMQIANLIQAVEQKQIPFSDFQEKLTELEKEKEQEFLSEMWEQEREEQISMSRGGL